MKPLRVFFILVLVFSCWSLSSPLIAKWLIVEVPLEKADAIFVLGGSAAYLERTEKASYIYKQGIAKKIFLTDDGEQAGWSESKRRNPSFVELARENLIANGVKEEDIETLNPQVKNTFQEIKLILETAEQKSFQSILIVTSAYHTRRTKIILESMESNTKVGILHAATGWQMPSPESWWLSVKGWKAVAGEYLKILSFWLTSWSLIYSVE